MNVDRSIAVVGCGALGSFYGAKLCRTGCRTHFLLRTDYEEVRRHGVAIESPMGDFHVQPRCARDSGEIGVVDLVLIGLKTTANNRFPELIPPLVGPSTVVLTLQNGLGNEEQLEPLVPLQQIMGGLCFVCLNRTAPGHIRHIDHGTVVLGEHKRYPEPRTHDIASLFRHAGIPCKVTDNLSRAHWEKLVWNIPFNGLGVGGAVGYDAMVAGTAGNQPPGRCLPTDQLLDGARWERLVRELMGEIIRAANAKGFKVPASLAEKMIDNTRTMGAYRASTLVDFEMGRPLELESMFLEPLRQAEASGVEVPRLRALCRVLSQLDARLASNQG